jgi:hypothetical protein
VDDEDQPPDHLREILDASAYSFAVRGIQTGWKIVDRRQFIARVWIEENENDDADRDKS